MNFKSRKWTVLLLLLLIFLSIVVFIKFSLGFNSLEDFKVRFLNSFTQNPFRKQSQVNVSLADSKLNLNFDLIEEDKPKFGIFINKWFGTNEEIHSISIGIDENTAAFLAGSLPIQLNISVNENQLEFKNQSIPTLQNALIKNDFDFATGSGKLSIKFTDPSKYQINIENPAELAFYATSSGILTVSTKIEGLFKSLPKIATIEMNVNGKNISGSIRLK